MCVKSLLPGFPCQRTTVRLMISQERRAKKRCQPPLPVEAMTFDSNGPRVSAIAVRSVRPSLSPLVSRSNTRQFCQASPMLAVGHRVHHSAIFVKVGRRTGGAPLDEWDFTASARFAWIAPRIKAGKDRVAKSSNSPGFTRKEG